MTYRWLARRLRRWACCCSRFKGRRRKSVFLVPPLVVTVLVLLPTYWWFAVESSVALLLPPMPTDSLHHYWVNRNLRHYITNVDILIEPSASPCESSDYVPVIIMVASAPYNYVQRQTVRHTWAPYQRTFFVLGLPMDDKDDLNEFLVNTHLEAKEHSDIILYDFHDRYQNLTLKTALMMKWTLDQCPQAEFLFKTDDDVMVNPWTLRRVLWDSREAELIGYSMNDSHLHRDEYNKWYIPRWMLRPDFVPRYLSGTGYLISGDLIEKILRKAYQVPMINLEDVYFTYLVALKELRLHLKHDRRLNPYKPWLKIGCVYWDLASVHSLGPKEMLSAWSKVENLVDGYNSTKTVCSVFKSYFYDFHDLLLH